MAVTITHLGIAGTSTSSASCAITTLADVLAGEAIILLIGTGSSGVVSVADNDAEDSNVYTVHPQLTAAPSLNRICFADAVPDDTLPAGSLITVSSNVSTRFEVTAFKAAGLTATPFDQQSAAAAANSTAPSAPAVTPSQAASLIVGAALVDNGYGFTFTQPAGYAALTKGGFGSGEDGIFGGWKEVAAAVAETYGPATISSAAQWYAATAVYKVAAAVSNNRTRRTMTGGGA